MAKNNKRKIKGTPKSKIFTPRNYILITRALIIAILVIIVDQLSKYYVVEVLKSDEFPVVLAPFLNAVLVQNFGIAFGVLNKTDNSYLIPLFIACFTIIALWWGLLASQIKHFHIPLGLITGGAVGNVIDRLHYGAVTDFIDFHASGWHYPAFNLADSFICIGVAILIFLPSTKTLVRKAMV